jgi:hypothetical protein
MENGKIAQTEAARRAKLPQDSRQFVHDFGLRPTTMFCSVKESLSCKKILRITRWAIAPHAPRAFPVFI